MLGEARTGLVDALSAVPQVERAALVSLPDGMVLDVVGEGQTLEFDDLGRMCAASFPVESRFDELVMLTASHTVILMRGRHDLQQERRLGLAVVCSRDTNPTFLTVCTRSALTQLSPGMVPVLNELAAAMAIQAE